MTVGYYRHNYIAVITLSPTLCTSFGASGKIYWGNFIKSIALYNVGIDSYLSFREQGSSSALNYP